MDGVGKVSDVVPCPVALDYTLAVTLMRSCARTQSHSCLTVRFSAGPHLFDQASTYWPLGSQCEIRPLIMEYDESDLH